MRRRKPDRFFDGWTARLTGIGVSFASLLWFTGLSCTPPPPAPQAAAPAVDAPSVPDRTLLEVRLDRPVVWPGVRQPDELSGLYYALMERGLSDLFEVAAVAVDRPPSPGLAGRLLSGAEVWTGKLGIVAEGDQFRYGLMLCDPTGLCVDREATASRENIASAVAVLLAASTETLDRPAQPEAAATWAEAQSVDPYAQLVAGRSAAVHYGIRAPVPEASWGDQRKDPVSRAVFIDPGMPVAWWIAGRERLARDEVRPAREAFTRATIARPGSVVYKADEAAMLMGEGRWEAAWLAWEEVDTLAPDDLRFSVLRATTALRVEEVKAASKILDALPARFQDERSVAELRVAIAEATGASSNYDDLLARWQAAAPSDPEPVRRRIALRVDAARLADALELTAELRARGAAEEADRLGMSLAVGLGDYDGAAASADRLGLVDVAGRIRARAALEARPDVVPEGLATAKDAMARLAAGEALLEAERADEALALAREALVIDPWLPEALDLQARALETLGRPDDAAKVRTRLVALDPAFDG